VRWSAIKSSHSLFSVLSTSTFRHVHSEAESIESSLAPLYRVFPTSNRYDNYAGLIYFFNSLPFILSRQLHPVAPAEWDTLSPIAKYHLHAGSFLPFICTLISEFMCFPFRIYSAKIVLGILSPNAYPAIYSSAFLSTYSKYRYFILLLLHSYLSNSIFQYTVKKIHIGDKLFNYFNKQNYNYYLKRNRFIHASCCVLDKFISMSSIYLFSIPIMTLFYRMVYDPLKYDTLIESILLIMREEGFAGFYSGLIPILYSKLIPLLIWTFCCDYLCTSFSFTFSNPYNNNNRRQES